MDGEEPDDLSPEPGLTQSIDVAHLRVVTPAIDQAFIGKHRHDGKGRAAVDNFAGALWDEHNGDAMRQLEMACADIDARVAHAKKVVVAAQAKFRATKRFVRRARIGEVFDGQ